MPDTKMTMRKTIQKALPRMLPFTKGCLKSCSSCLLGGAIWRRGGGPHSVMRQGQHGSGTALGEEEGSLTDVLQHFSKNLRIQPFTFFGSRLVFSTKPSLKACHGLSLENCKNQQ